MNQHRGASRRASLSVLCGVIALSLLLTAAPAEAGRASCEAFLDLRQNNSGQFQYTVDINSDRRRCERDRKVTIWHDENRNGVLDEGEFVIAKGRTNNDGRLQLVADVVPPIGDWVGVLVKQTPKCKEFSDSFKFQGFPE